MKLNRLFAALTAAGLLVPGAQGAPRTYHAGDFDADTLKSAAGLVTQAEQFGARASKVYNPALMAEISNHIQDVVERTAPSVVSIEITGEAHVRRGRRGLPPFLQPPAPQEKDKKKDEKVPSEPKSQEQPEQQAPEMPGPEQGGSGSGVLLTSDGYIITNHHVVEGAKTITVKLADKRSFPGKLIGDDSGADLAVVKIDATGLKPAKWGSSSKLKMGNYVIAIGAPFGLKNTATLGIVSAVGRNRIGVASFENAIQTDAAINPGNSGGALFNAVDGTLVGVNNSIYSRTGGNEGIGFAIPQEMAQQIAEQIIKTGKVTRGWLGVAIIDVENVADMPPDVKSKFPVFHEKTGVGVQEVTENGPAVNSGLKPGDIIVSVNGASIEDMASFRLNIAAMAPGTVLNMQVLRWNEKLGKSEPVNISTTLGTRPSEEDMVKRAQEKEKQRRQENRK